MGKESRVQRDRATDISALITKVVKEKKWRHRLKLHAVFDFWEKAVGSEINAHAQPSFIRGSVLWVHVSDSVWMQQLHLQKTLMLEIINQKLEQGTITDIRFQLSTSVGREAISKPLNRSIKPIDKEKLHEFEALLFSLKNEDVKVALKNLWVKWQTNL